MIYSVGQLRKILAFALLALACRTLAQKEATDAAYGDDAGYSFGDDDLQWMVRTWELRLSQDPFQGLTCGSSVWGGSSRWTMFTLPGIRSSHTRANIWQCQGCLASPELPCFHGGASFCILPLFPLPRSSFSRDIGTLVTSACFGLSGMNLRPV